MIFVKTLFSNFRHEIGVFILILLVTGCQSFGRTLNTNEGASERNNILKHHVVMFDKDGYAVDPTGNQECQPRKNNEDPAYCDGKHSVMTNYPRFNRNDFTKHVSNIIKSAKMHAIDKKKVQVLFFVHGGLNTQVGSLEHIVGEEPDSKQKKPTLYKMIMKETKYYPIFINWQSSLRSSYFDHLLYVRQGEKWPMLAGWLTAPVVLAADIGRSILRAPLVWGSMIYNDTKTAPVLTGLLGNEKNLPDEVVKELLCHDAQDQKSCSTRFDSNKAYSTFSKACWNGTENLKQASVGNQIIVGVDERRCPEMGWKFFQWLVTIPTKLVISPFLDAFGKSAWDNMLRSIQLLYQVDKEFHVDSPANMHPAKLSNRNPGGGLSIFFDELVKEIYKQEESNNNGNAEKKDWEITWVGHSAGTIIINEAIRRFGLPKTQDQVLPFNAIVYMAAASTLHDVQASVYPYLQNHQSTHFYHLMLHEKAEEGETVWQPFDLPPRGSLLVWIDDFLSNPLTHKERTAGKYQNFFRDYHSIPKNIRDQIHLRVFSQGKIVRSGNPQKHGEFTDRFRFWDAKCWTTDFSQTKNDCVFP
ncbi:MAG: hypothetical protein VST67_07490 [Nitrospirota bacterium]|nr:hypothetical protein [Nitrospirota bacterium]